jgi:hypothetical protein
MRFDVWSTVIGGRGGTRGGGVSLVRIPGDGVRITRGKRGFRFAFLQWRNGTEKRCGGCHRRQHRRELLGQCRTALVAVVRGDVIDRVAQAAGLQIELRAARVAILRTVGIDVPAESALVRRHGQHGRSHAAVSTLVDRPLKAGPYRVRKPIIILPRRPFQHSQRVGSA